MIFAIKPLAFIIVKTFAKTELFQLIEILKVVCRRSTVYVGERNVVIPMENVRIAMIVPNDFKGLLSKTCFFFDVFGKVPGDNDEETVYLIDDDCYHFRIASCSNVFYFIVRRAANF